MVLQSNYMLTPEKQLVCTAMETELFFFSYHDICGDVIWSSLCTLRCQGSKTFHNVYQRHWEKKKKKKVNNLLSFYSCPKAQTVSQQTILSRLPALFEDIYRPCSICHQNQESAWQDSLSPPVLCVYAHVQLHTVMEKSQHSC